MADNIKYRDKFPWRILLFIIIITILVYAAYLSIFQADYFSNQTFRRYIVLSSSIGIISSILFLFITTIFKPSIRISEEIAKFDGKYVIKITNKSWFFDLLDVKVALFHEELFHVDNGINVKITEIDLKRNKLMYIPSRLKEKEACGYAQLFMTEERLENRIDNNSNRYMFNVYAKHSFTNFGKIIRMKYLTPSTIVEGKFKRGDNFGIFMPNSLTNDEEEFYESDDE